jgi:MraZ protein
MAAFYGTEKGTLDPKRRLSVPVSLRRDSASKQTHDRFFLKHGSEGCLQLYSVEDWRTMEEKLNRLLKGDREDRDFVFAFLEDACWVTVDAQGRITIPPALQDRAGLGKDVVLRGIIGYIAIWSAEKYGRKKAVLTDDSLARLETLKLRD